MSPFTRTIEAQGPVPAHARGLVWIGLLLMLFVGIARAQPAEPPPPPRIGVLTMAPGEVFWERFGHDAIVVAPANGQAISYNFGYFDMTEPGFVGRFLRGRMQYMLVALPLADDLVYYRDVGRGVTLQWLDLPPGQAQALADALAENARPENARYRYDYFTDNCATRVRDALNHALGGQLRRRTESRSSGDTWRSEALRLSAPAPWMWLGFDIILGPASDKPLTRWQQDFLPRRLADDLRELKQADGRPLVANELSLLPHRQAAEPDEQALALWPWLLCGAMLAGMTLVFTPRRPRLVATACLPFWLACGLLGWVLACAWAFTDHQAIWANRNLLLMNPLCLLLLPGAWAVARGKPPARGFRGILVVVAATATLACLPLWLQVSPQRNGHWLALLLPLHAALAWAFLHLQTAPRSTA